MTLSPNITRHILPSGLTILIETLPYVRSVSLGYYLRSGSAVESEEHSGASHFLEHLVFKGTARRTTSDIAQIVDILGGDVDAFTGKEYTSFYAHVLDEQVDTALDLLTDIVVSPRFSEDDLESERSVILEEIKMVEDTPDDLVHEIFVESFWPDHPLGRPILGTEETVNRLRREQIVDHYRETFHPANVIFVASGNIRPEQIIPTLERFFPPESAAPLRREWTSPLPNQHVILREKRELEQVHVCLGSRGFPQQGDERYAAVQQRHLAAYGEARDISDVVDRYDLRIERRQLHGAPVRFLVGGDLADGVGHQDAPDNAPRHAPDFGGVEHGFAEIGHHSFRRTTVTPLPPSPSSPRRKSST